MRSTVRIFNLLAYHFGGVPVKRTTGFVMAGTLRYYSNFEEKRSLRGLNFWHWIAVASLKYLCEQGDQLSVDRAVGDGDVASTQAHGGAFHVAGTAARFANQQQDGDHVPGVQPEFQESIQPPTGNVGQVDRSRAAAPDSVGAHGGLIEEVDVDALMPLARGEAGGEQGALELRHGAGVDPMAIEISAAAEFGGEQLLPQRIEDHAADHLAGALERQRDIEHWIPVGEVGGAVERVDVPLVFRGVLALAALFAKNRVRGEKRAEALDDERFAGAIGLCDEVVLILQLILNATMVEAGQKGAGFASDVAGGFQKLGHEKDAQSSAM